MDMIKTDFQSGMIAFGLKSKGGADMTDLEAMYHRFSHANIHKSTGVIAAVLGVSRKEYEAAVKRGIEEYYEQKRKSDDRR